MQAAVVHQFKAPLKLEEVPVPELGPGEILVRVEAAGAKATSSTTDRLPMDLLALPPTSAWPWSSVLGTRVNCAFGLNWWKPRRERRRP